MANINAGKPNAKKTNASKLNEARRSDSAKKGGAQNKKKLNDTIASAAATFSLAGQIQLMDILFVFAITFAIIKDASDIFIAGGLWGLGTILSWLCSIMGGLYMWLIGQGTTVSKKKAKGFLNGPAKRFAILLAGTLVESFVLAINFLPVQTITFFIMYFMILKERAQSKQEA